MNKSLEFVDVRTNWLDVYKHLDVVAKKQVPFASAVALTRLAQAGQARVRRGLPSRLRLRSGWVADGIRVVPAKKWDWPRQFSAVGSKDDFMVLQETGGVKRPKFASQLVIPAIGTKRGAGGRIPKSQRPKALLGKRRGYFLQTLVRGRHAGKLALLQRTTGESYPLRVVFIYDSKGNIKPVARIRQDVLERAQSQYPVIFAKALRQAIAQGAPKGNVK